MPAAAKTMVVKIGSSTVTEPGTGVNRSFIARLAHEAVELRSLCLLYTSDAADE